MLNTGKGFTDEFEMEAVRWADEYSHSGGVAAVAGGVGANIRREGGAIVKAVKSKVSFNYGKMTLGLIYVDLFLLPCHDFLIYVFILKLMLEF